jgi:putative tryptophan/tyrosine transport system substrate-binding protein
MPNAPSDVRFGGQSEMPTKRIEGAPLTRSGHERPLFAVAHGSAFVRDVLPCGIGLESKFMRRREFIALVGGSALVWPLATRAQQAAMPVIGFLHAGSPAPNVHFVAAFRKGLRETGYVDGQNVTVEFRWAEGQFDRLSELAADLVNRKVAVIATPLSTQAALAAKAATTTIPIVFTSGSDPIKLGLVASLNRPGGNVTGISFMSAEIDAKRFGLAHELLPGASRFVSLLNPNSSLTTEAFLKDLQAIARTLGLQVEVLFAGTDRDIDAAFATAVQKRAEVLLIAPDELFTSHLAQLAGLSLRHALPSIYHAREFAEAGGLMSYGPNFASVYQEVGTYTGRILKGEKPAELPVQRPTKFELVINLKTAKALNLTLPPTLLATVDDVID